MRTSGPARLAVRVDLPTRTGYDPGHVLARGEVGEDGVSVSHLGDLRRLFAGVPLEGTHVSMNGGATALWLLALHQEVAVEQGADPAALTGTTHHDLIAEFLSPATAVFPPGPTLRLAADTLAYTVTHLPRWTPVTLCGHHLRDAGASAAQEIAYTVSTALLLLETVRLTGRVAPRRLGAAAGQLSLCAHGGPDAPGHHGADVAGRRRRLRAFTHVWDRVTRERYGVTDARGRAHHQGRPLPLEAGAAELADAAEAELPRVERAGGLLGAVESGTLAPRLLDSRPGRGPADSAVFGPGGEEEAVAALERWRATREESTDRQGGADPFLHPGVAQVLTELKEAARTDTPLGPATLECVRAGVTTGEWAGALRSVFGPYTAPGEVGAHGGARAVPVGARP